MHFCFTAMILVGDCLISTVWGDFWGVGGGGVCVAGGGGGVKCVRLFVCVSFCACMCEYVCVHVSGRGCGCVSV